jgi:hypothetical protein
MGRSRRGRVYMIAIGEEKKMYIGGGLVGTVVLVILVLFLMGHL